jgi:hypothetical protein
MPDISISGNGNSYQIYPAFPGTDTGCTNETFLLPPLFTSPNSISFNMSLIYSGPPEAANLPAGFSNTDFAIAFQQNGSIPQTVITQITLNGTDKNPKANMWACEPTARSTLMANFTGFLGQIEKQLELAGLLVPGATSRIGQQIADNMPAPLLETLFYRYSFSPGFAAGTLPYVDLRPGMRLRIETQISQFLTPDSPVNGYIGSGTFYYQVNSVPAGNGTRVIAFDPFLGTIKAPSIQGGASSPVVAGGLIDLQLAPWPYWRLFYPSSVPPPLQSGDLNVGDNVTLVGVQNLEALNSITTDQPSSATCGAASTSCTIFLGRAIAVPEIPIWINDSTHGLNTLQYVPVGTTLANIIERFIPLPLDPNQSFVNCNRISTATGSLTSVGVSPTTNGLACPPSSLAALPSTMWDLPLISGDSIVLSNI